MTPPRSCRLCRQSLTTVDGLWANTGQPPLDVHIRCAQDFGPLV